MSPVEQASLPARNSSVDVVKGMLVVVMLIYHCASVSQGSSYWFALSWLPERISFIHYAFLIISGFLCGWHYAPKLEHSPERVRKRLLERGLRLITLMFLLNILLYMSGIGYTVGHLLNSVSSFDMALKDLILTPKGSLIAFEILFHIGVLLIAASILLGRISLGVLAGFAVLVLFTGNRAGLAVMVALGLLGTVAGLMAAGACLDSFWKILEKTHGIPVLILFLVYQFFLPEIRVLTSWPGVVWITFALESVIWFLVFTFVFRALDPTGTRLRIIPFLGRYTLIAYILQMLITRVLYMLLKVTEVSALQYYTISLVLSTILMVGCIAVIDYLRKHSAQANTVYRLVLE